MSTVTLSVQAGPHITIVVTYDDVTWFASSIQIVRTPTAPVYACSVGLMANGKGDASLHSGVMATAVPVAIVLPAATHKVLDGVVAKTPNGQPTMPMRITLRGALVDFVFTSDMSIEVAI